VVHEIFQRPDGTLEVRVPASVDGTFRHREPVHLQSRLGDCSINSDMVEISAPSSFGCATAGMMPEGCKLEATVTFSDTRGI
jgi:beta-fructofuranosidase